MDFEEELADAGKTRIRLLMRETRDAIGPELRAAKNESITQTLLSLDEFREASSVMAYVAFGNEVDPAAAMRAASAEGKHVYVPDHFGLIDVTGVFARRAEPEDVDFRLIPGFAFDENGFRLGYGGGWYDKFSSKLREGVKLAGLAYEEQVVRSLPAEPHDLRLDLIITDERVIRPV